MKIESQTRQDFMVTSYGSIPEMLLSYFPLPVLNLARSPCTYGLACCFVGDQFVLLEVLAVEILLRNILEDRSVAYLLFLLSGLSDEPKKRGRLVLFSYKFWQPHTWLMPLEALSCRLDDILRCCTRVELVDRLN